MRCRPLSFITVQYERFLAESCVTVQYKLCLEVSFITGKYKLFLAVSSVLLCSRCYFRQCQLL